MSEIDRKGMSAHGASIEPNVALGIAEARHAAWSYGGRAEHILRLRLTKADSAARREILQAALDRLPDIVSQRERARRNVSQ